MDIIQVSWFLLLLAPWIIGPYMARKAGKREIFGFLGGLFFSWLVVFWYGARILDQRRADSGRADSLEREGEDTGKMESKQV